MKTFPATILPIIICFYSSFCQSNDYSSIPEDGVYAYQETVGEKIVNFFWKAENNDNLYSIKVFEERKSYFNLCSGNGNTLKWVLKEKGKHDIVAERQGDEIHIQGTRFGEEYSETVRIDNKPWYQPLSFSLGDFLDSTEKTRSFWVVRADTVEVISLKAVKKGIEILDIFDKNVPAQKIEIRPAGLLAPFWLGTYWFRESDNLFLQYQSVHGMPGTDETVVKLIDLPEEGKTNQSDS